MPAKPATSRPLRVPFVQEYLRESRGPLASLAFVLPLLIVYEGGLVVLGSQAVRNGADVWLRQFLDALGFGQHFLLPALTVAVLLGWHYIRQDRWRVSVAVLYTMFAECAVLGLLLVALAQLQAIVAQELIDRQLALASASAAASWAAPSPAMIGRMVGFVGAGIYEEMLFRLLLLPPIFVAAARLVGEQVWRVAAAVVLTSLIFAMAHYLGKHGETFEGFSFWCRFTAGAFFALLFVYRGFGIAAGTHALYDIFVSLG